MRPKPSAAPNPVSVDSMHDVVLLPVHRKANPLHCVQSQFFSNVGDYVRFRLDARELEVQYSNRQRSPAKLSELNRAARYARVQGVKSPYLRPLTSLIPPLISLLINGGFSEEYRLVTRVTPCNFPDPTESTGHGNWHEMTRSVSPS